MSVDVAVAGHDRYLTDPPILVEQTLVVQNSLGGEQLSVLSLQIDDSNRIIGHELENIVITEETAGEDPYLSSRMMAFKKAEHRSRMSDRQVERMEKLEEERKKILQLSPQEFIKKMQSGEIDY